MTKNKTDRSEMIQKLMDRYPDAVVIGFDGAEASSPVTVNGDGTQYQVADFRHRSRECAIGIARLYDLPDTTTIFIVGSYWSQADGWYTSVTKHTYRRRC